MSEFLNKLSRREFLGMGVLTVAGVVVSASGPAVDTPGTALYSTGLAGQGQSEQSPQQGGANIFTEVIYKWKGIYYYEDPRARENSGLVQLSGTSLILKTGNVGRLYKMGSRMPGNDDPSSDYCPNRAVTAGDQRILLEAFSTEGPCITHVISVRVYGASK